MTVSRTAGALAGLATLITVLLVTLLASGVTLLPSAGTAVGEGGRAEAVVAETGTTGLDAPATATALAAPAGAEGTAGGVAAVRDGEVTIDLVGDLPDVAQPGDTVTLTLRVTNGRDTALDGAQIDLGASWQVVSSRAALAAWALDDTTTTALRQKSEPLGRVEPGASTQTDLALPVDILGLGADAPWGPRAISLAVVSGGEPLDVLHTFLLFAPDGQEPSPVSLSVVAPVTGPAIDPRDPAGYDAELAGLTAPDGRLTALAAAGTPASAAPGVALAVDPALVAAAQESDEPTTVAWAEQLTDGTVQEVVTLSAFDPDVAALAHSGLSPSEAATGLRARAWLPSDWQAPAAWGPELVWPAGRPDVTTMATARQANADHVLVSQGLAPRGDQVASARTAVGTSTGKVSALVADEHLSVVLARITGQDDAPTPAEAAQQLRADTALLAAGQREQARSEGVATAPSLLAALPRGWSPDAEALHQVLGALDAAEWADVVTLGQTIATPASDTPRHGLPRSDADPAELAPETVVDLAETHRAVAEFASVADDPDELSAGVDRMLVFPLAHAFRDDTETRAAAVSTALERAGELRQGISVADRSAINLVADTGALPVLVRNDLPADATVTVVLRPDDPRLKVESRPTVVVPAGSSTQVPVEVRAIGSGDVDIAVEVLAPSGAVVAEPTTFSVTVRAGWETVGTGVVAAAVGLLFVAGIWRTVRRGRSTRRTTGDDVSAVADPPSADAPSAPTPAVPPSDQQHAPSEIDRT